MFGKTMICAAFATVALSPALAQSGDTAATGTGRTPEQEYQRGYAATPMPNQAAIDARSNGAVNQLNGASAAVSQANGDAQALTSAAVQAQYDADRMAYMDALVKHDRAVDRTDERYRRQQNAYADAMAVWRAQVDACHHGDSHACNRPAPNPADFY